MTLPASAQDTSGYLSAGALLTKCRSSSVDAQAYCFAYIAGVSDAIRAYQAWLGSQEVCLPDGVSQSELVTAFEEYMTSHPTQLDAQAASIAVLALQSRFGCEASVEDNTQIDNLQ
ncbi:Rap1a/Tai family immunity protein [Aurantiacibacter poecillastricola]|uniref:Rap1a/Tai family immunity protein n=1 Tax=Aurantiacibacter poecillastricola TaxID=3064385 RepID=UPI00273F1A2F|nr:Rap1a/Tai family immunity protein [Aurantiacibacter sp. 219JJ12-13]MDP5263211.1 Rap1a/Tai family immunity protein [Aurantiacibacter sp. 219JJ12-13]